MNLNLERNPADEEIAHALNSFVRNSGVEDVTVAFERGIAHLNGQVPSSQTSRAMEDLVSAHDGVESVVNNLVVARRNTWRRVRKLQSLRRGRGDFQDD